MIFENDGFAGDMDPDPTYGGSSSYSSSEDYGGRYYCNCPSPSRYSFDTEEQLITSAIFQRCLGQSLAWKDKEIMRLRMEILELARNMTAA